MTLCLRRLPCFGIFLSLFFACGVVWGSGAFPPDVAGAADHPLIKRFTGSALIGYRAADWDQTVMPTSAPQDNFNLKGKRTPEGKLTRLVYLSPMGKTPLEVFRNYEQALNAVGFKKIYACETNCMELYSAWSRAAELEKGMRFTTGKIPEAAGSGFSPVGSLNFDSARMLVGTVAKGGAELSVLVFTSLAHAASTGAASTYIEIIEPKAMPAGQVTADASAIQAGLVADGKMALYGLFFDTGKAVVKPESAPQLAEIAKVLKAQPALKVFLVGHTDNQGTVEANTTLSQQRAQAVANALVNGYQIDPKRLFSRGFANLAPVASNASETGRAKNRRVELVLP